MPLDNLAFYGVYRSLKILELKEPWNSRSVYKITHYSISLDVLHLLLPQPPHSTKWEQLCSSWDEKLQCHLLLFLICSNLIPSVNLNIYIFKISASIILIESLIILHLCYFRSIAFDFPALTLPIILQTEGKITFYLHITFTQSTIQSLYVDL